MKLISASGPGYKPTIQIQVGQRTSYPNTLNYQPSFASYYSFNHLIAVHGAQGYHRYAGFPVLAPTIMNV